MIASWKAAGAEDWEMYQIAPFGSAVETDDEPNGEERRQGQGGGCGDCEQDSQTIVHDLYSGLILKIAIRPTAARLAPNNCFNAMQLASTLLRCEP